VKTVQFLSAETWALSILTTVGEKIKS